MVSPEAGQILRLSRRRYVMKINKQDDAAQTFPLPAPGEKKKKITEGSIEIVSSDGISTKVAIRSPV